MNRPLIALANPALLLGGALLLSACGQYTGEQDATAGVPGPGGGPSGGPATDCQDLFAKRVQPRLAFCRTCHIAGGIADVPDGNKFLLTSSAGDDYAKFHDAWAALGGNGDGKSRLLKMASGTDTRSHSGGTPWPVDGAAYKDVDALLQGFDTPAACQLGGTGTIAEEWPLLAGPRGGGFLSNFCDGKPDDTVLPVDPRQQLQQSSGRNVAFNAYWTTCGLSPRPTTCGKLRAEAVHGRFIGEGQGEIGTPLEFAGGQDNPSGIASTTYNNLWSAWGLSARPDNFDELVVQRFGSPHTPFPNPYPKPGEETQLSKTFGGTGQLPLALTQIRKADGTYTGQIGTKVCVYCHNGEIGTEAEGLGVQLGGAGSIGDFTVAGYDIAKAQGPQGGANSAVSGITISTNRGTGAIDFFQLAFVLFSGGDPNLLLNDKIVHSQAIGNIKSPPWWNLAYRSQKFHGAVLPTDSVRIDMAAYWDLGATFQGRTQDVLDWVDSNAGTFQVWTETLKPPKYPRAIDPALAEQGAILFHSKNLWANTTDPTKPGYLSPDTNPKPDQGNGSCAGCHGAYSPRYTHDDRYLKSPDLAGVAAYTVPMSVIRTDPVYADAMQSLRDQQTGEVPPSVSGQAVTKCGPPDVNNGSTLGNASYTENLTPILLAPSLWGIWAAAPYFHNGSVPNIWGVLDPAHERPKIWERVSAPVPEINAADAGKIVMGYDTDLRSYDFGKLGWKYTEHLCDNLASQPFIACNPVDQSQPSPVQQALAILYTQVGATWNLPRPEGITMTKQDVENRKIFNTNLYSQGNQGHDFTAVLTDNERKAIIEYLKTL